MSSSFYRVDPEPVKHDGYGFRKVTQNQLVNIIERVSKTTYSSRIQSHEPEKIHNYQRIALSPPPRTPVSCRRRISIGSTSGKIGPNRVLNEHEIQRLVRRVRKPTKAYDMSRRDYEPEDYYNNSAASSAKPSRPVTASERKKAFDLMSRPTTASRAKDVTDCHLCDEREAEANKNLDMPFEYPYADDQSVATREEVASIVGRVRSPTKASQKGQNACWCTPVNMDNLHYMSEQLPLVSGMGRSKSVNQIVNRLHHTRGSYRRGRHGYEVKATPISNFCL